MNIYNILLLLLLLIITVFVVSWLNWRMVRHTTVILLTVIIGWTLTSVTSYVPHGLVNTYHYTVQAHLSAGQHACVCLLSGWAKNDFFLPAAVTRCTVMFNVKFDKFQLKTELWDFSPQNCQNMHFCQKNVPRVWIACTNSTKFLAFIDRQLSYEHSWWRNFHTNLQ